MAVDRKYGKLTFNKENTIGDEEPVVVLRAQDALAVEVLGHYMGLCAISGSPQKHLDAINTSIARFKRWQQQHPTKIPD